MKFTRTALSLPSFSASLLPVFACLMAFALSPNTASAQVFKCVDANGKTTYSNDAPTAKGCKQLSNEQAVSTINMRASAPPASFPKITDEAQRERDKARRQVLENELNSEQSALEDARKALAEQEGIRLGGEKNYQKALDRLQPYKDAVSRRERNVEALTQELSGLR